MKLRDLSEEQLAKLHCLDARISDAYPEAIDGYMAYSLTALVYLMERPEELELLKGLE